MLAIEVAFLSGRYVATAYNTRTEAEWPPHPARLFSALVATHFAADSELMLGLERERAALQWLEQLGPPEIRASESSHRDVVTVFVPVNDVALTNVDSEAQVVAEAREAWLLAQQVGEVKDVKASAKRLKAGEAAYAKALRRALEVPARPMDAKYGARVLPEHRGRQPRTFPSVTPESAKVVFVWMNAEPTGEQHAVLDALLRRVVRLGHSSSLVSMRLTEELAPSSWVPSPNGSMVLRVVGDGQLAALERAFAQHRETEPRVMPFCSQSYGPPGGTHAVATAGSAFSHEWLVLRRIGGSHLPMTATAGLARRLRRALMSFSDPVPEVLSGHAVDRTPTDQPHLAIVPLPFVGHAQATGLILGIALVMPRSLGDGDRRSIYAAVAAWEVAARLEDEDAPALPLHLGSAGEFILERVDWGSVASTLTSTAWCRPASVWSSVTPVAVDHNPGDLRSRDVQKLARATAEAVKSVKTACERIGLPVPRDVEILPAPSWAGAAKARHYPRFPEAENRTQRVLTHARIVFDEPVLGPVLIGAGRYLGLGLFRPEGPA